MLLVEQFHTLELGLLVLMISNPCMSTVRKGLMANLEEKSVLMYVMIRYVLSTGINLRENVKQRQDIDCFCLRKGSNLDEEIISNHKSHEIIM